MSHAIEVRDATAKASSNTSGDVESAGGYVKNGLEDIVVLDGRLRHAPSAVVVVYHECLLLFV